MEYENLIKLRNKFGYSGKQMAKLLNITPAYYCQIEKGSRNLSYNLACKIAKIFMMKPDEVFYNDHIKKRLK